MSKLEIVDPETGVTKEIPVSEFIMQSYKEALIQGREREINVTSIIREIHLKSRLKKTAFVKLRVDGKEAGIEIPALALSTLSMYSQDEINDLVTDSFLSSDFEKAYSSAIPDDLQPSTSKQRTLALRISELLGIDLGYEILASKRKLGAFISDSQKELERYERDIEGVDFISERLEDALIKYFSNDNCWRELFNSAYELYLQVPQRAREVIHKNVRDGISDSYWNEARDVPEGNVVSEIISEISFKLAEMGTHAEKFENLHTDQQ
ncbi:MULTISPECIES: hypothetical protein [Salinivibrio]|uniref:Uncharacterized protein n=1 Tax=Salinivibrio proteolyticus TaxID=334715 RepID=A0ABY7LJL5_9GAMM|nr:MULTISPECIES: hypothetical protein [Salinivibrio]KKA43842.1 hypothetical protein WN56_16200 [Salinivibrio sp. KP-1]PCE65140.1 hypothetical protein B6G00_14190 [Salinivibrio sp. YCSC6]QCF37813.1 hypothetical protein E8E00_16650 [Salinivibrio sp. YCSC6]WBA16709.1 hypothetical protein N7E60_15145 [Salinivibrio proteolyticus]